MKKMEWEKVYSAGPWKIEAKSRTAYVLVFPDGFEEVFRTLAEAKERAEECRVRNPRGTECRDCMHWGYNHRCDWWGETTMSHDFCSNGKKGGGRHD